MHQPRLSNFLITITVGLGGSCNQPQIDFPKRAPALAGTYQADSYYNKAGVGGTYPIRGQTMTLKLVAVADDSVRVEIEAAPNEDYSPGSSRVYEKLLVNQEIDANIINKKQVNCITYSIDLPAVIGQPATKALLRKRCRTGGIDYFFVAPVSKAEATVVFR
jgi:hypothetical protein